MKPNKGKGKKEENDFKKIEDLIEDLMDSEEFLKWLIYGRSGTGKTTILGTMPKPLLLLDVRDYGTKSIKYTPGIKRIRIKDWDMFEETYWYLLSKGHKVYKSVGVDTITQLGDMALRKANGADVSEGTVIATRRDHGNAAGLMRQWILNYRDLPMHVGFAAQDRENSNEEFEDEVLLPEIGPYCSPSVAKILNAAVDVIGQTFIRETIKKVKLKGGQFKEKEVIEFCMRVGPHARYTTKFRRDKNLPGPVIPQLLVNPTFEEVIKYSLGGKMNEKDK